MAIFENVDGQAVVVGTGSHANVGHGVADSISKTESTTHRDANHVAHELRQTVTQDVNGRESISQSDTSVEKGVKYVSTIALDGEGHATLSGTRSIDHPADKQHGVVDRESVTVSMPLPSGMPLKNAEAGIKSLAESQAQAFHKGGPLALNEGVSTEVVHAKIQTAKDGSTHVHQETLGVDSHGIRAAVDEISTTSMGKGITAIETRHQDGSGGLAMSERLEVHSRGSKGEDVVAQHTETLSAHTAAAAARSWSYGGAEKELSSGGFAIDGGLKRGIGEHVGAEGGAGPAYPLGAAGLGHLSGGAGGVGVGEHAAGGVAGGAGPAYSLGIAGPGHLSGVAGGVGLGEHVAGGVAGGSGPGTPSLSSHTHDSIVSYLTDKAGYATQEAKHLVDGVSDYLGSAIHSHVSGSGGALEFNKTGAEAVSMNHSASGSLVASNDGSTASIPMDRLKAVHESGMVQDLASRDMASPARGQEISR